MKKVNFKKLKVETKIGHFEEMDVREQVGNTLHQQSMTIPMSELAKTIFYSEKEIEIEDSLFEEMIKIITPYFKRFLIDAIISNNE